MTDFLSCLGFRLAKTDEEVLESEFKSKKSPESNELIAVKTE
jgi:hypothetical protein